MILFKDTSASNGDPSLSKGISDSEWSNLICHSDGLWQHGILKVFSPHICDGEAIIWSQENLSKMLEHRLNRSGLSTKEYWWEDQAQMSKKLFVDMVVSQSRTPKDIIVEGNKWLISNKRSKS